MNFSEIYLLIWAKTFGTILSLKCKIFLIWSHTHGDIQEATEFWDNLCFQKANLWLQYVLQLFLEQQGITESLCSLLYLQRQRVFSVLTSASWCCCLVAPCGPLWQSDTRSWSSLSSDLHFLSPEEGNKKKSADAVALESIIMTYTLGQTNPDLLKSVCIFAPGKSI